MFFKNRKDAGEKLAEALKEYAGADDVVVMGLARGGVVVAAAVSEKLKLPLSVAVVKKLGAPGNPELAIGAVGVVGEPVVSERLMTLLDVTQEYLVREVERQRRAAQERTALYMRSIAPPVVAGKRVILIDDGVATGASMQMAVKILRTEKVKEVIVAVPVGAPDSLEMIKEGVERVVCLHAPLHFEAVGTFYKEFEQVEDETIITIFQHE